MANELLEWEGPALRDFFFVRVRTKALAMPTVPTVANIQNIKGFGFKRIT
jgi:hypothetical protein